ncbi:MAG: hypothetical protein GXP40_01245 [Chloroflexi bacterium]|nr:hypothetical protein [Chloroflexota bacterium]
MEFFFDSQTNPDIPRLDPEDVRIVEMRAEPYPDGRRVRVNLDITPYKKRPHLEVTLTNPGGDEVSTVSIIEPLNWKIEFTMHIRGENIAGTYTLDTRLFYPPRDEEDPKMARVDIPVPDTDRRSLTVEISRE